MENESQRAVFRRLLHTFSVHRRECRGELRKMNKILSGKDATWDVDGEMVQLRDALRRLNDYLRGMD